jgi:hypothetical protein
MDATIIDWTQHGDLSREKLRDLLIAAFGATLLAAQTHRAEGQDRAHVTADRAAVSNPFGR